MENSSNAFAAYLGSGNKGISEGSIFERLRRDPSVKFDPEIYHASLIYTPAWAALLEQVHRSYLDVGHKRGLAMFTLTDTWRASQDRIDRSSFRDRPVNFDNAQFLRRIAASYGSEGPPIFVGGQTGPKGDGYKPEEAPDRTAARAFHQPQIDELARGGVDFLYAATLPSTEEAHGIAAAMATTGLPYVLSFVVRRDGRVLDGAFLADAMTSIDEATRLAPVGYAINCVYPTAFISCLHEVQKNNPSLIDRIVSFQANGSPRDPSELDGSSELLCEDPKVLARLLHEARDRFGTCFLGGCCGTDTSHIIELAQS